MMKISIRVLTFTIAAFIMISPSFAATTPSANSSEPTDPAVTSAVPVDDAVKEFKGLSKKEKKGRLKEAKKVWKKYLADKKAGKQDDQTNTILLVILAILLPPLAIYLKERTLTWKFWVSLLLIIPVFFVGWYFWFAAVILALLVVLGAI